MDANAPNLVASIYLIEINGGQVNTNDAGYPGKNQGTHQVSIKGVKKLLGLELSARVGFGLLCHLTLTPAVLLRKNGAGYIFLYLSKLLKEKCIQPLLLVPITDANTQSITCLQSRAVQAEEGVRHLQ
jgi:hypothetical protein